MWRNGNRQDAFTETYLTSQKSQTFSDVGVLIYVFDVESRSFEGSNPRDLLTYTAVISALAEYSPSAHVFALVHKIDLVQNIYRDQVIQDRTVAIREYSGVFSKGLKVYGTTIWDQSLYKAWGDIVKSLVSNLGVIDEYLQDLAEQTQAEEIILFERATFLTVTNVTSDLGERNPYSDRQERLSNVIKTFKHSLSYVIFPVSPRRIWLPADRVLVIESTPTLQQRHIHSRRLPSKHLDST